MPNNQIIIPMEPQPTKLLPGDYHKKMNCTDGSILIDGVGHEPPHAVGDRIPVREEWRLIIQRYGCIVTQYKDDATKKVLWDDYHCDFGGKLGDWQPASTMPDWAMRERVVTKVEANRLKDNRFSYRHFAGMNTREHLKENPWVWLVTTKDADDE